MSHNPFLKLTQQPPQPALAAARAGSPTRMTQSIDDQHPGEPS